MSDAIFGELRSLLHRPYNASAWDEVVRLINQWPQVPDDPDDKLTAALNYIKIHLDRWPPAARYASHQWFDVTIKGQFYQKHPALTLANGLSFAQRGVGLDATFRALEAHPIPKLFALDLSWYELGESKRQARSLAQLGCLSTLSSLQELILDSCGITWEGALALAHSLCFDQLRKLSLRGNRLTSMALERLVQSPYLLNLLDVSFRSNPLGAQGAIILASSSWPRAWTSLNVAYCGLQDEGVCALATSPHLSRLERLVLGYNLVGQAGVEALGSSSTLRALRELDLTGCRLDDDQALSLTRSPLVNRLERLGLADNPISAQARAQLHDLLGARLCWDSEMG